MAAGVVEGTSPDSSTQAKQTPGSGGARAALVQQLLDADNLPAFLNSLLTTQAVMVAGTEAAGFLIEGASAEQQFSLRPIAHIRPDNSDADTRAAALAAFQELVHPCVTQGKDGAIEVSTPTDGSEAQFCLITLLRSDGNLVAVSAVITRCLNLERARQRLTSMQLVAGYFELFTLRRTAEQSRLVAESHQHAMQLASAVAIAEGFQSSAMGLCNELANRAGATRVSLGWMKGNRIRIKALSHTEDFDKKQELVVQLEKVMEECVDQEQVVQYVPNGQSSDNVTRAAAALSRSQGGHSVISIPLRRRDEIVGVVTLEFLHGQQISPNMGRGLAVAVDLLAPQLFDRHENDRWLITKTGLSAKEMAKMIFGRQHTLAKLIVLLVIGSFAFVWFFKPMYHVSPPFNFATNVNNIVSAPVDGRIAWIAERQEPRDGVLITRKIKPGDVVKEGEPLVRLDTTEATINIAKARGEMAAKVHEVETKRAQGSLTHDDTLVAQAQIAEAEYEKLKAEVDYYQYQIDRSEIKAPFGGTILKGDLEDKLHASVKLGDPLMEIGNPEQLRAELMVDDRDIHELHIGQTGRLATHALPDDKYNFVVDRIIPVGQPKEGSNVFTVYARIEGPGSPAWRPGMAGEARINVEHRRLAWIWTHRLIDFLKLKLWM